MARPSFDGGGATRVVADQIVTGLTSSAVPDAWASLRTDLKLLRRFRAERQIRHARERLAPYKLPRRLWFVAQLDPGTATSAGVPVPVPPPVPAPSANWVRC